MSHLPQKVAQQLPRLRFVSMGSASVKVAPGQTIALYNTTTATAYAAIGKVGQAAPSAPSAAGQDILPLKPSDWTLYLLSSDEDKIVAASSIAVYVSEF